MRDVAIVGAGMTKFGELWDKSLRELVVEAGAKAIEDANVEGRDIEAIFGGCMASGALTGQEHVGALLADHLGLNPIPSTRVESACASGGLALRTAYTAVASGMYDIVAVGGVEKMTEVSTADVTRALGGAGDQEWELFNGATFPSLYALMARRYMFEYGATEEQLAAVAVKNHHNAMSNPYAQYHREITIKDVMNSGYIASPLKLLDCSPITDGSAAVILTSMDKAKEYTSKPIKIRASAQASDSLALSDRKSLTSINAARVAAQSAFKQAGLSPKDIGMAEVHDCFSIAEILAIEDIGFFKRGEGARATAEGRTAIDGEIAVNTSGGLKACGHPVGATGIKQAIEAVWQLRGEASGRQVKDLEYALTHNVGGSGASVVVHIFERGY